MFLPVAYMYSLFRCALYDIDANVTELKTFTLDCTAKFFTLWFICSHSGGGGWAFYYLILSGFYSVGGLAHPYLGFWILQHVCEVNENDVLSQPTISYYGNHLWNLLNYNELLHVEHHDFSRIPWNMVHELRRIAPEYYLERGGVMSCKSILQLVKGWVLAKGDKFDFCCEHVFAHDL